MRCPSMRVKLRGKLEFTRFSPITLIIKTVMCLCDIFAGPIRANGGQNLLEQNGKYYGSADNESREQHSKPAAAAAELNARRMEMSLISVAADTLVHVPLGIHILQSIFQEYVSYVHSNK